VDGLFTKVFTTCGGPGGPQRFVLVTGGVSPLVAAGAVDPQPPRNEQVRGSIPRGGSTALTWANNPGQSLAWTGRVLTNLILSPLMESIVVRERLLLRWCWLPINPRRGTA
jgi:hypothetical protein